MTYIPGLDGLNDALSGKAADPSNDQVLIEVRLHGRVSPQHVANVLRISRSEAQARLQSLALNGLIKANPSGWYEASTLTNFQ